MRVRILIILICSLSGLSLIAQKRSEFVFTNLDGKLLDLWIHLQKSPDPEQAIGLMENIKTEWILTRKTIKDNNIEHFDNGAFMDSQDLLIYEAEGSIRDQDWSTAEFYIYHFIWEFREIRDCFTYDEYAFDQLWKTYDAYQQMKYIVNDPMMGLYEWNEFVGLYKDFKEEFKDYKQMSGPQFENSTRGEYIQAIAKVEQCIAEFDIALRSAYQPNFELPCDQIGESLIELFGVYTLV